MSSQLDEAGMHARLARASCTCSAAHGPLIESSVRKERDQDALKERDQDAVRKFMCACRKWLGALWRSPLLGA